MGGGCENIHDDRLLTFIALIGEQSAFLIVTCVSQVGPW